VVLRTRELELIDVVWSDILNVKIMPIIVNIHELVHVHLLQILLCKVPPLEVICETLG